MKFSLKHLVLLILLPFNFLKAEKADSLDNTHIEDLSDRWLQYKEEYKAWFPLLNKKEENLYSVSQLLDLDRYKSYNLNFEAAPGLSLFIENKLVYANNSERKEKIRIPVSRFTHTLDHEKELISFYHPEGVLPLEKFYIGYSTTYTSASFSGLLTRDELILRMENPEENLYVIIFLVILLLIVILKTRYPRRFFEFFSFSKIVPEKDDTMIWDPAAVPFLLFGLINALCSTLILLVIKREFDLQSLDFLNIFTSRSVLGVLIVTGVFCMIYFLKYIQLGFLGWVFNVRSLVKYQFLELMKVSLKVNIFLTVLILVFYGSAYGKVEIDINYFFYFTIFSLVIVLLRVGYLTFTLSGFRNIYLFSYLCTTEILPLVIIAKIILL